MPLRTVVKIKQISTNPYSSGERRRANTKPTMKVTPSQERHQQHSILLLLSFNFFMILQTFVLPLKTNYCNISNFPIKHINTNKQILIKFNLNFKVNAKYYSRVRFTKIVSPYIKIPHFMSNINPSSNITI